MAGPQTTVPLDNTTPRAVVHVHRIQKDWCDTHAHTSVQYFIDTPEKARQKYRHGEQGERWRKHTQTGGLGSHGEGGLKDCACWSGGGKTGLVFVVILVVLILVIVIPHVRHRSLHTRAAVVRVI